MCEANMKKPIYHQPQTLNYFEYIPNDILIEPDWSPNIATTDGHANKRLLAQADATRALDA